MATITRENIGLLQDKLVVNIQKADYLPNFEKALKNYSKNANLPGFRKGMVPTGLIKKMYGQSAFADEVLKTIEKELFAYLDTEKLEIFAQPVASDENDPRQLDVNNPQDYSFGFEIGLKPVIIPANLSEAKLTKHKIKVTGNMVDTEIERLQNRFGTMQEPETVASEETVLYINLTPSNAEGETMEGDGGKEISLELKNFTTATREQLKGKKKDDLVTIYMKDAFEKKELDWVLQELGLQKDEEGIENAYYRLQITKLGLVTKKPLDEELFKAAFPAKELQTEAEFREAIEKDIEIYWENQSLHQLQDSIYHYLIDHTEVAFPENFLKKWMQTGREKPSTAEEVELEFPKFSQSLKWTLISDTLSKDNNLQVGAEDLKDFAKKQLMGYMGIQALDESHDWVEAYAEKMLKDKKFVEDSYHRVSTEKLFEWATQQVVPAEKEISAEAFAELQHHHEH